MKKILKKGVAFFLAAALALGGYVCITDTKTKVQAQENNATGKTIAGLGTEAIADPVAPTGDSDAWK